MTPVTLTDAKTSDPLSGQPWWLRAIAWVGVPTALAVALIWFLLTAVWATMDRNEQSFIRAAQDHQVVLRNQQDIMVQIALLQANQDTHARLLLAICMNTGPTETGRATCLQAQGMRTR